MKVCLVSRGLKASGTLPFIRAQFLFELLSDFDGAQVIFVGEVNPRLERLVEHPIFISGELGPLDLAVALREVIDRGDVVHCLDFEAAVSVVSARLNCKLIVEPFDLPSLTMADVPNKEAHLLKHMELEERVFRQVHTSVFGNLHTSASLSFRGLSQEQLRFEPVRVPMAADQVSEQSLVKMVYQPRGVEDGRIVYEALQRLGVPWRLSVLATRNEHQVFWERDSRIELISEENWRWHLSTSMFALFGGLASSSSASGITLDRFALWAPHYGVLPVGTDDNCARALFGGRCLVPAERPDLLAEKLLSLARNVEARRSQHIEIRRHMVEREKSSKSIFPSFWEELLKSS